MCEGTWDDDPRLILAFSRSLSARRISPSPLRYDEEGKEREGRIGIGIDLLDREAMRLPTPTLTTRLGLHPRGVGFYDKFGR